jgi:UDP-N-acetyl-D-mannosaminuronic acid dehydrogenase
VKEHIYSPAFLLGPELEKRGARPLLHDPLYTDDEIRGHGFMPASLDAETLPEVVILNTAHDAFANLDFAGLAARGVQVVVDGRAFWDPDAVRSAGLFYLGVGRPVSSASEVSAA